MNYKKIKQRPFIRKSFGMKAFHKFQMNYNNALIFAAIFVLSIYYNINIGIYKIEVSYEIEKEHQNEAETSPG